MGILSWFFGAKKQQPEIKATFDLAQTTPDNRKHWASADSLAARAALSPAVRKVVRIRSRYEAENNSWYSGILQTAANHVIGGPGPRLQISTGNPEVDRRIEAAWIQWCRVVDFQDTLRLAFVTYWRDGEVFLIRRDLPYRTPVSLDVALFEADQVAAPWSSPGYGNPFEDDGVRFDSSTNELQFYVYRHHPGSTAFSVNTFEGDWYPARQVVAHLFRAERPGQIRGVPRATPALQTLPIMRRQELATLYSAETAANFAMYLKSTSPALDPSSSPADFAEIELTRNMLTTLPAGWEIGQVEPKQPGPLYEMFQRQALMSFCRCTNMPYTLAAGTGKDANFSSFKGDMRNVWEPEVRVEQNRIENTILEPVLSWFLEAAVFSPGILAGAPPFSQIEHRWHWPPLPELDPSESAAAAEQRMLIGLSAPSDEHAKVGSDFNSVVARMAADYAVDEQTVRQMLFQQKYGALAPTSPQTAQAAMPQGEYTNLSQRDFNNNQRRIQKAMQSLIDGSQTEAMVRVTLQSIGLAPERIDALIQDAADGKIDTPQEAAS